MPLIRCKKLRSVLSQVKISSCGPLIYSIISFDLTIFPSFCKISRCKLGEKYSHISFATSSPAIMPFSLAINAAFPCTDLSIQHNEEWSPLPISSLYARSINSIRYSFGIILLLFAIDE